MEKVSDLEKQVEALKKSNRKKDKKLKEKAEEEERFMEKFKGLEISLGEKKEEPKEEDTRLYANGDGRGEL